MKQLTVITSLFILLSSFQSVTTDQTTLYNSKWILHSIYDKDRTDYIYTHAFIEFDNEKKRISGNGSCNLFGGAVAVNEDAIRFTDLFSTKMACAEVQEIESAFLHQLRKVNRYEIKGNKLLMYNGEELLLQFNAQ